MCRFWSVQEKGHTTFQNSVRLSRLPRLGAWLPSLTLSLTAAFASVPLYLSTTLPSPSPSQPLDPHPLPFHTSEVQVAVNPDLSFDLWQSVSVTPVVSGTKLSL